MYGNCNYQISKNASQNNDNTGQCLFLESKISAPSVAKPSIKYCLYDSSLSVKIYTGYANPGKEVIVDNPTNNKKLEAVLLKYQ